MNKFILLAIALAVGLLLLVWWLPSLSPSSVSVQPTLPEEAYTEVERGSFAIARGQGRGGALLGEEHYTLGRSPQGQGNLRLISQVELTVQGVELVMAQELRLAPDLKPLFYRLEADTPQGKQEIEVLFAGERAELSARGGGLRLEKEFTSAEGFLVVDNNLPSHLLIVYELIRSRGELEATALVPQALVAIPLRAARAGSVGLTLSGGGPGLAAERFSLWLGDVQFQLYAAEGELIGGKFPGEILIYRNDRFPEGFVVAEELEEGVPSEELPPGVREEEVSFASFDGVNISGSLTLPEGATGPVPAVLMIAGSGPTDRDENAPGLRTDFFKAVAYALAQAGLGSLRYDKRGVGRSEGEFRRAGLSDLVGDARAALEYLRARSEVDPQRVFLLGHSEGGVIAPLLAVAAPGGGEAVSGLVLIAAPAHPLDWLLLEQAELIGRALGLPEEAIAKELDRLRRFIAFVKASEGDWEDYSLEEVRRWLPELTPLEFEAYKAISLRWYREHFAHDPLHTIRQVRVPVLIIHGEKDIQVPPGEGELLFQALQEAGNEEVELHLLPDLNHLMRYHPEEPTIAYRHLDEPVDEGVLGIILDWLRARGG